MKTVASARFSAAVTALLLFGALAMVGVGFGLWVHPGAGVCAAGLLLWVDLLLWSRAK